MDYQCFFIFSVKIRILCFLLLFSYLLQGQVQTNFNIGSTLAFAESQYSKAVEKLNVEDGMPRNGNPDSAWRQRPIRDWTSGFFPGTLWYLYDYSKDEKWLKAAQKWTDPLKPLQYFDEHHDTGFMVFCSYGNGYRLTKDKSYKGIILQTAKTLATRYRPGAKTILSWGNIHEENPKTHKVIIDNMMNLEMLQWAYKNGGDEKLHDVTINHANTTMKHHFRDDYSSYHLVQYDPSTGEVQKKSTVQGYADDSMWARGQAWGIYGFTMMFRETGKKAYLDIAERLSKTYFSQLPEDYIAYWDFNAPNIPNEPRDTASAAIAASASLELYQLTNKVEHYNNAVNILNSLSSDQYLAKSDNYTCVLLHSTGHKPIDSEVDVNINYTDYYFVEALLRLKALKTD